MTDDAPSLLIDQSGAVVRATLNRPAKLNALDTDIFEGLLDAARTFARRDDQRVFLIRATGRYFCAGVDLTRGDTGPSAGGTSAVREWYRTTMGPGMHALYDEMERIEKPFVVAHHGPCVGGGLEMSLACDFRLAAKSARYVFPEAKLGAIPAGGGISRLTRLLGPQWAKWILMADQPIDADRALMIGLVQDVYEDAVFEARVAAFCAELATKPPEMMAMAKLTINLMADAPAEQARGIERLGQSILHVGDEMKTMFGAMRKRLSDPS
jgi:enoyl-CoA hydratase/carnithine racemase